MREPVLLLRDEDVRTVPPAVAVAAARRALEMAGRGELAAPPRISAELGDLDLVFTAGAVKDGPSGFRVYRTGNGAEGDQLVAVWDADGALRGVVVGEELGARRTGALGAVAADVLARPDARSVGIVGSGRQAWTHLWALTAVRHIDDVRVFSPGAANRERFVARARAELGLAAQAAENASLAVRGADIVVLATSATSPVIDADDVSLGAHVTTLGPKSATEHEAPLELFDRAALVTCDSPAQAAAYSEPFVTDPAALVPLAEAVLGKRSSRREGGEITLFCSVGLAGSEIVLAEQLFGVAP